MIVFYFYNMSNKLIMSLLFVLLLQFTQLNKISNKLNSKTQWSRKWIMRPDQTFKNKKQCKIDCWRYVTHSPDDIVVNCKRTVKMHKDYQMFFEGDNLNNHICYFYWVDYPVPNFKYSDPNSPKQTYKFENRNICDSYCRWSDKLWCSKDDTSNWRC